MTLTEFLLARIAEDEAVWGRVPSEVPTTDLALQAGNWPDGESAIVLTTNRHAAECAAKRRIVDTYEGARQASALFPSRDGDVEGAPLTADLGQGLIVRGMIVGLKEAVQALALPYADHPDYDPMWRP